LSRDFLVVAAGLDPAIDACPPDSRTPSSMLRRPPDLIGTIALDVPRIGIIYFLPRR